MKMLIIDFYHENKNELIFFLPVFVPGKQLDQQPRRFQKLLLMKSLLSLILLLLLLFLIVLLLALL